ncbi:non-ribosomal peptide synthetase [Aquimarina longa]|uniref:non-ribosomal peptide synthetase n=1 Tax=Aquimarina longa TaxID=1080221 RepID=UPI00078664B5|nr:non-ribosomal peptide synthetase [Aquimarina longa]
MLPINQLNSEEVFSEKTLVEVFKKYLNQFPDKTIYRFLENGEEENDFRTYQELYDRAKIIASHILKNANPGDRVLLLYPSGLDFTDAFFGCLIAGVIAVPAFPPQGKRRIGRLENIVRDCKASFILTTDVIYTKTNKWFDNEVFEKVNWLQTNILADVIDIDVPSIQPEDIAFLQYTSGSTGAPKGVKVTHANIIHNNKLIQNCFNQNTETIGVSWLPIYHDMGLIGNILQAFYVGFEMIIMPPTAFIQKPVRWLKTITKYKATYSGGPNFAYDLCANQIKEEERIALDLSSWFVAYNGSEPIRPETMDNFANTFSANGFKREYLSPCYGMAETTLVVSACNFGMLPEILILDKEDFHSGKVNLQEAIKDTTAIMKFMGNGPVLEDMKVKVVDPETKKKCNEGEIGEIWISGASVAKGYWQKEEITKEIFQAYIHDSDKENNISDGPYLRTGDMGFIHNEELYISGRLKEMMIFNGVNHYPQDIERAVQYSHPDLQNNAGASISVHRNGNQQLVIIQEVKRTSMRTYDFETIVKNIREAVFEKHELAVYGIVLISPGRVPKTSSGKIQRVGAKIAYEKETIDGILEQWEYGKNSTSDIEKEKPKQIVPPKSIIEQWFQNTIADQLGVESNQISLDYSFAELGINSLLGIRLSGLLSEYLRTDIPQTYIFEFPTIRSCAQSLDKNNNSIVSDSTFKIKKQEDSTHKIIPSYQQESLWFLDKLGGSKEYHVYKIFKLSGVPDLEILQKVANQLITRHQVLRTTMVTDQGGKLYQNIVAPDTFTIEHVLVDQQRDIDQKLQEIVFKPFDLSKDFSFRLSIIEIDHKESILVFVIHHIAADGYSESILLNEFTTLYNEYLSGDIPSLPPLPVQYADYAIWQNNYLRGSVLEDSLIYWKNKLQGVVPLNFPYDFLPSKESSKKGKTLVFDIENTLKTDLEKLSKQEGVTLFMTVLAVFKVLLHRYSGQRDICVGIPIANRRQKEVERLIGFFVNTLAIRSTISEEVSFDRLLQQVKETNLEAYKHQVIPFEEVVKHVAPHRELHSSPIYQVMFTLQNSFEASEFKLDKFTASHYQIDNPTCKYDFTFILDEQQEGFKLLIEYNTALFTEETISQIAIHYKQLLHSVVANTNQSIHKLPVLSSAEEKEILKTFNDTTIEYPKEKTVVTLFREQVEKTPNHIAVVSDQNQLTYKELEEKSNQLAHYLLATYSLRSEDLIGILVERTEWLAISMLAILKTGCAYVPMDTSYPVSRINHIKKDTKAKLIIDTEILESFEASKELYPNGLNVKLITAENLAYIIYTSGSTGIPKGVMIAHQNIVRLAKSCDYVPLGTDTAWLATGSISFDAATIEFWGTLLNGGKLVITDNQSLLNPEVLKKSIEKNVINTMWMTASWFHQVAEEDPEVFEKLNYIIVGGDKVLYRYTNIILSKYPNIQIINGYGPTENTTFSTTYTINTIHDTDLPIGKPIQNSTAYVLDESLSQLQPKGVIGELCVAGDGLSRGYLNAKEETQKKFITNPFVEHTLMYCTGDLVRWLPDGNLEFIGRKDDQVKIRGYRIELGEIENVLATIDGVKSCCVLAKSDTMSNKRLVGYIVSEQDVDKEDLQEELEMKLPEYMVPKLWVMLDSMPLTTNGKTDKKRLPDPGTLDLSTKEYVPAQNDIQQQLVLIWQELLGIERVGIYDNFFELGGDSIITIQVISRMKRAGYHLQPKDIFEHQTIYKLAKIVNTQAIEIVTEQGKLEGSCELLPIQQWYFEKMYIKDTFFNQSLLVSVDKKLSQLYLEQAIQALISKHDGLRFQYRKEENKWNQYYDDCTNIIEVVRLHEVGNPEQLNIISKEYCTKYQQMISVDSGILFKVVWIKTPDFEEANKLFIVAHHIVIDAVSWRILIEDLGRILEMVAQQKEIELDPKGSSYRQWVSVLQEYANSKTVEEQVPYWQSIASVYKPLPNLDPVGIPNQNTVVKYESILNKKDTALLLTEVHHSYTTEIQDILLSCLALTIQESFQKNEIVIGLEGHGREQISDTIDLTNTVGWFTSLYPVSFSLPDKAALADVIKHVKEELRNVPDKGLGYGALRYLNNDENIQQTLASVEWDIVFNYLGQLDTIITTNDWFKKEEGFVGEAEIDHSIPFHNTFVIDSAIIDGELRITWKYSSQKFDSRATQELANQYLNNLQLLISHCIYKSEKEFTPSDYGLGKEIGYKEFDAFYKTTKGKNIEVQSIYKLSPLQEGMLFHELYEEANAETYIVQVGMAFKENVQIDIITESWNYLLQKYSILRTVFSYEELSIPVQLVHSTMKIPIHEIDISDFTPIEQKEKIASFLESDRRLGFNLNEGPLLRITLLKIEEDSYQMIITNHHILIDGWSMAILIKEFVKVYQTILEKETLPEIKEDIYEDYIKYINTRNVLEEETFWKEYIKKAVSPTILPFVKNKTVSSTKAIGKFKENTLEITSDLTQKVEAYAKSNHVTVNTIMQGAWALLLSRYTGNNCVSLGVTVSGRPAELENSENRIGLYINTIPLCTTIQKGMTISEWLVALQSNHTLCREHQYTSLANIQSLSPIKGDLFNTIMVFENYPVSETLSTAEALLELDTIEIKEQTNYPLALEVTVFNNELSIKFIYNTSLIEETEVKNIQGHLQEVLQQMVSPNTSEAIEDICIVPDNEKKLVLEQYNATEVTYDTEETIITLFQQQVSKNPDHIAVMYEGVSLSYIQLDKLSTALSQYLLSNHSIEKEDFIAVKLQRSEWLIISFLAVIKSGAVYLPIDPNYPEKRIQYIEEDSQCKISIDDHLLSDFKNNSKEYTILDIPVSIKAEDLAYIIYTSGSTGLPKGVLIEHGGIVNTILSQKRQYAIGTAEHCLQFANSSFDASIWEILTALLTGSRLCIIPDSIKKDTELFTKYLEKHTITWATLPPAYLKLLDVEKLHTIKMLITAGEEAPIEQALTFAKTGQYINAYGPTETSICATVFDGQIINKIPIGKPIDNTKVYILSEDLNLQPHGIVGELCVSGKGVARGYLNKEELTAEKFIPNPFISGERIYRTGDLARWLPDGTIEFIGRKDNQVKIRGHRIELGEIESMVSLIDTIQNCCIVAKTNQEEEKYLVAYVVSEVDFNKNDAIEELKQKLPEYMIPQFWITLDTMPITSNGKINREALPEVALSNMHNSKFVAPRNETEIQLVRIWQRLLKIEKIGVYDDFFDLGGHSLLATRLVSAIRKEMNVEITIRDVFDNVTISQLALFIGTHYKKETIPLITRQKDQNKIPLSFSQERLWFLDQMEGSIAYHMPLVLRLEGTPDSTIIEASFKKIIQRHEVLRTVIVSEDDSRYTKTIDIEGWYLEQEALEKESNFEYKLAQLIARPFDLSKEYMLKACLYRLTEDTHILAIVFHHIASDGWSINLMIKEFTEIYNAYVSGKEYEKPNLLLQYSDYAIWQRAYTQGSALEEQLAYWKQKLDGIAPLLLPTDYTRPSVQSMEGASMMFWLEEEMTSQLKEICKEEKVTLFMLLLSAFKVLLFRYSGQDDISVGTPVANRPQKDIEDIIGFFVNTLVLRSDLSDQPTFRELLQQIKEVTLDAYEHQQAPFEKVVEKVLQSRDMSMSPLFQVLFVLQNTTDQTTLEIDGLTLSEYEYEINTSKFDVTLMALEKDGKISLGVEYCTALFKESTIRRMLNHYQELLSSIIKNLDQNIACLSLLTAPEEHQLLESFVDTEVKYPKEKTIVDIFKEQVLLYPDNTAVTYMDKSISYQELHDKSNQLANFLITKEVKKGDLVGICLERSLDMIIGILGILKSGGVYVPIDPGYPKDRIDYIIKDSSLEIVISKSDSQDVLMPNGDIDVILLDQKEYTNTTEAVIYQELSSSDLAYIIYTSGSTGNPKGVLISHENVVRLFKNDTPLFDFNEQDVWTLFHSFCFDFSVWEIFGALLFGGRLVIVPKDTTKDVIAYSRLLKEEKVTVLNQTPKSFYVLQDELLEDVSKIVLRYVIFGGEALNPIQLQQWKAILPDCKLINMYGITETTVHVTYKELTKEDVTRSTSTIGKAIPTLSCYILDEAMQLIPIGVTGEICVSGAGLAKGYLNREELTNEKFVDHPFKANEKLYRSGDLGRWLPDGSIEYIGRKDDQVKIRGYRIELGEIESVLSKIAGVRHSCVLTKPDIKGNNQLVGYVVTEGDFNKQAIQSEIRAVLPEYMVPQLWLSLEEMPLTSNGKIAKKILLAKEIFEATTAVYEAPRNATEVQLARIWKQVLGIEKISVHDNFFELGGHSLLATQLVSAIRKEMTVELTIREIFANPTIAQQEQQVAVSSQKSTLPAITKRKQDVLVPLSFSQERLWFIDQLEGSIEYHMPISLDLKGALNIDILERALREIISRHEVLRTVIYEEEGVGYQKIMDAENWSLERTIIETSEDLERQITKFIDRPFDLYSDYMLRICVFEQAKESFILGGVFHHIASDGWSNSILIRELATIYRALQQEAQIDLPALQIQYADYALWQREYVAGAVLDKELEYWKEKLKGVSSLMLPLDYTRPAIQSKKGAAFSFSLDQELTQSLYHIAKEQEATLFMVLLATFKVLLHQYSNQEDICVGTPIANRTQKETEDVIGFFVNTLAIRSNLSNDLSFLNFLQQVKTTTLEAYEHQLAPLEKVVESVVETRDMSMSPLFQVMFVLQNTPDVGAVALEGIDISMRTLDITSSVCDLTLVAEEKESGISLEITYCTELFNEETIARMTHHYTELITNITENPSAGITTVPILPISEQNQLLNLYNDTIVEFPKETLTTLFNKQVEITPEAIALVYEEQKWTYEELNTHSNQMANYLLAGYDVEKEDFVAVKLERSNWLIVALLAIQKIGATYVPIDPNYPEERINYIEQDSGCKVIIDTSFLHKFKKEVDFTTITNPVIKIEDDIISYVIYTSGSTGKPKGVMIEHRGIVNTICSQIVSFGITENDACLQFSNQSFDASISEIFVSLLSGAKLVIIPEPHKSDSDYFIDFIKKHEISWATIPPAFLKTISIDDLKGLNTLVTAGEQAPLDQVKEFSKIGNYYNAYGPTETSICATIFKGEINSGVPIGRPIHNTKIYVLSETLKLQPKGVVGELCVAGKGLAKGYLNQEELTNIKFVENPFISGERIYKTGDLVRILPNNDIEFIGRKDDQVKIRGYRIELGEIEQVVLEQDDIISCCVLAKKNTNKEYFLVGYMATNKEFDEQEFLDSLKTKFPEYMIPKFWVYLDEMPITTNGKIDKKALPEFKYNEHVTTIYVAPRNTTEAQLVMIWSELLKIEKIGINDNFFTLGGHSLLATRLVSAIRKIINVEINIRDIFLYTTIAELGQYIDKQSVTDQISIIKRYDKQEEYLPLSFSQERLWFIDQLEGTSEYNMPVRLHLTGILNPIALEAALLEIIDRHKILRTVLKTEEGKGYQHVIAVDEWSMDTVKSPSLEAREQDIEEFISQPFDLSKDYMVRVRLYEIDEKQNILIVVFHHIATDGWSNSVLIKELVALYASLIEGKDTTLSPLAIQYSDYAIWQRDYFQGTILEQQLAYWKDKLQGGAPLLLPTDYTRPAVHSTNGASFTFSLDQKLSTSLKSITRKEEVTLFMLLISAFKVLLYKYSGQEDISVGTPIANRTQKETEDLIGFFVNTLVIRSEVSKDIKFKQLLKQVKENVLGAYEHQQAPFEKVVDTVVKVRDRSLSPLFQVMFVLQNTPEEKIELEGLTISNTPSEVDNSKYDLTLAVVEDPSGIMLNMTYCTDLFREETIRELVLHYEHILVALADDIETTIADVPILTKEQQTELVHNFNDTHISYPKDKTVVDIFNAQVQQTPEAMAVVFKDQKLTYSELNSKSNQLARKLRKLGVQKNVFVGICTERSSDMIVSILSVLKAGGVYVPIDPDFPEERVEYMIEDTGLTILLTTTTIIDTWEGDRNLELLLLDKNQESIEEESDKNLIVDISQNDLAYIIYTSGSTGTPKGVMVSHDNVTNLAFSRISYYGQVQAMLLLPSFVFDPSVAVILGTLLTGGKLIVPAKEEITDATKIKSLIAQDVDILLCVPSYYEFMLNESIIENTSLRGVILGGEQLHKNIVDRHYETYTDIRLYNEYGPTECTVWASVATLENNDDSITIGRPVPNTQIYVLDAQQQLVPRGVIGELYIAGAGVSKGYLNQNQLTKTKFVSNPLISKTKMYRTGDLGRWLSDGRIEFIGRTDDQVKIRGYRIELGEIEKAISKIKDVINCSVLAKEDTNNTKQLVGYVVSQGDFDKQKIKEELKSFLPDYMIPKLWILMEEMPLTSNGKIDKKALPTPDFSNALQESYVAPRNELEKQLVLIWQELLQVEHIGIYNNFFELGGDSIITIQVVSKMNRLGYAMQPRDLFEHQIIADLAVYIALGGSSIEGEQGVLSGTSDLLPIQQWYFDKIYSEEAHFNQAVLISISKEIKDTTLQQVAKELTTHHDALRFMYNKEDNSWIQSYGVSEGVLETVTLENIENDFISETITNICDAYHREISIEKGNLFKLILIKTPESDYKNRLFLLASHLVVDGVSWRILLDDLNHMLTALHEEKQIDLGKKGSSYREWGIALQKYAQKNSVRSQQSFWKSIRSDYKELPIDKHGTVSTRADLSYYKVVLDKEYTTELLTNIHQSYGTEIEDILMSCLTLTINEWTKENTLIVGLEGHGREDISKDIDISNTVGWFTNVYPVSLSIGSENSLSNLIKNIKEQLRKIPDKGLGYGALLNYHSSDEVREDIGKIKWDILFNYLGQLDNVTTSGDWFEVASESPGFPIADITPLTNKLEINSSVTAGVLQLEWGYSTKQYNRETIEKLAHNFISNLMLLIEHCKNQEERDFTPSDYGLEQEIGIEELETFFNEESDSEEVFKI